MTRTKVWTLLIRFLFWLIIKTATTIQKKNHNTLRHQFTNPNWISSFQAFRVSPIKNVMFFSPPPRSESLCSPNSKKWIHEQIRIPGTSHRSRTCFQRWKPLEKGLQYAIKPRVFPFWFWRNKREKGWVSLGWEPFNNQPSGSLNKSKSLGKFQVALENPRQLRHLTFCFKTASD